VNKYFIYTCFVLLIIILLIPDGKLFSTTICGEDSLSKSISGENLALLDIYVLLCLPLPGADRCLRHVDCRQVS